MEETWKPVAGFEAHYQVSDLGRVRRISSGRGAVVGKVLRPLPTSSGHCRICFYRDKKPIWKFIHRLVAEAFLGPCPSRHEVNHKDGQPSNNSLANLEYLTHKGNYKHASETGLMAFGTRNGANKLSHDDVRTVFHFISKAWSDSKISKIFNVCPETIRKIRLGKTWLRLNDRCSHTHPTRV